MADLVDAIAAVRGSADLKAQIAATREKYSRPSAPVPERPARTVEEKISALKAEKYRLLNEAQHEVHERLPLVYLRLENRDRLSVTAADILRHLDEMEAERQAEQKRLDEEERSTPEYRRKVRQELICFDEEVRALIRQEREPRRRKGTQEDDEDHMGGLSDSSLENFLS